MNRARLALASLAALVAVVAQAVPAQAATAYVTNSCNSNRNLSVNLTADPQPGLFGSLAPCRGGQWGSFYSSCSGTTIYQVNGGAWSTVPSCTWRKLTAGNVYVVRTAS